MKFKENVIEALSALLFGSIGIISMSAFFFIISLLFSKIPQKFPYKVFTIEVIILIISLIIYYFIYKISNKIVEVKEDCIIFKDNKSMVKVDKNNIISINYIKCPWYLIPIMYFYKYGNGGLVTVKYIENDFEKERNFKTFFKNVIMLSKIIKLDINIKS